MDLILTHIQADFDAVGAMIGAKRLYPRAIAALPPQLNDNVQRFLGVYRDAFGMVPLSTLDLSAVERVILVDCHDLGRVGVPEAIAALARVPREVFDHHPERVGPLAPGAIRAVGAASTILARCLEDRRMPLTPIEASGMLLGIYEDTGRLTYAGTTAEDARAVAYLLGQGARLDWVAEYLDVPLTPDQHALLAALERATRRERLGGREVLLAGFDHPTIVPGLSTVVERWQTLYRPVVAVVAVRTGSHTQIVARSTDPAVAASELLAPWGGGGHPAAAAAHDEAGLDPARVLAAVREALVAETCTEPTARQVMSAPVRTLDLDESAAAALEAMRQWGHPAMPIVHNQRVQGVVMRRDVDRAVHHGFGDRPLRGLASRQVAAVSPDTPLSELRRRLAAPGTGRLLVLEGDHLIGIVSRTDLIRALGREPVHESAPIDVAERLRHLWPADWVELVTQAGRIAGDRPLFLVGGAVRDLLLARPSFDLDLMVEGDAIALARDLAAGLGAHLKTHPDFGTAHLSLPDGRHLDLATARVEFYPSPGSLPVVSPSTVEQDLARRDFTINALALRLNPERFGVILDRFGGLQDLEHHRIRILHPVSFIEDPVRLFRAVRFEQKLGFRMESETEAYGRFALESGRFDGMANERLKLELRLAGTLGRWAPWARRLEELDAWRVLNPTLHLPPEAARHLVRLDRLQRWRPPPS